MCVTVYVSGCPSNKKPGPRTTSIPLVSPPRASTHTLHPVRKEEKKEREEMSTESMTTSLRRHHTDQEDVDLSCNPEPYNKRRASSFFGHVTGYTTNNNNNTTKQTAEKNRDESWSLKKFLRRHVSTRRYYRVLEREPNRLRKRFTQY